MGPLDKDVVRPDGLRAAGDTLELELRSHWYRSLPLTSLAVVDVAIDGAAVDSASLAFRYEGGRYSFAQLAEHPDDWWYVTDPITVEIPHPRPTPGTEHRVQVGLGLRIPYILIGPPDDRQPLLASSQTDKTLVCN